MPFWPFQKEPEEEKAKRQQQEAAVAALVRGDLPPIAQERLENFVQAGKGFFTSDLTAREYLFAREAGYQPISQVMGTCFMNVSLLGGFRTNRQTGEVVDVSKAQLDARDLAIGRMQKEAQILKATGVIGVRLIMRDYDWSSRMVEFTAVGTAINVPGRDQEVPFTSALSGQEFWQLHQAGYWPKGLCLGVCSYYIYTDQTTRNMLYSWFGGNNQNNQEVYSYTTGFYKARQIANARLMSDIAKHDAEGVVGVKVQQDLKDIEYEINDRTYHDILIHLSMIGTSVVRDHAAKPPQAGALMIYDLKDRSTHHMAINNAGGGAGLSEDLDDDFDEE